MLERTKRISFRISSVSFKVEPEPEVAAGPSHQLRLQPKCTSPAPQHCFIQYVCIKQRFGALAGQTALFRLELPQNCGKKIIKKLFDPRSVKAKKFALHEIKATIMTKTLVNNDTLFESSSCLWITI